MTLENVSQTLPLIDRQIASRREVFAFWMTYGADDDCYEGTDAEVADAFKRLGNFYEYGLEIAFEPANETEDGHFRYLLSTGDPHEELRFFPCGRIEFVSKPWFQFHRQDVTSDEVFCWVRDYLTDISCLDFEAHDGELYHWEPEDEDE